MHTDERDFLLKKIFVVKTREWATLLLVKESRSTLTFKRTELEDIKECKLIRLSHLFLLSCQKDNLTLNFS